MRTVFPLILLVLVFFRCGPKEEANTKSTSPSTYLDYSGKDDVLSGGVKMIQIKTSSGNFKVWTKRVGNNPKIKVLLLHGGPGSTHEYFECFDSYFPKAEIEYYYYDQLESAYSDQPYDTSLWSVGRYVDEVEQVRQGLVSTNTIFIYLGLHGVEFFAWSMR